MVASTVKELDNSILAFVLLKFYRTEKVLMMLRRLATLT